MDSIQVHRINSSSNELQIFTIRGSEISKGSSVVKHAWKVDGIRCNSWKDNFMWVLLATRASLRFPYSTKPNGELQVKYFSLSFLYWIVGYSLMFGVTINNILPLGHRFTSEDIDTIERVIILYKITIMAFVLSQPLSLVKEWPALATFINECPDYLMAFEKGLGTPVKLHGEKWLRISCSFVFLFVTAVVLSSGDVLIWMDDYSRIVVWCEGMSISFVALNWIHSTYELSKISHSFCVKIHSELCTFEGKVSAAEVKEMRLAWLELTRMIKTNANSFSFILSQLLSWALICVFIMSCFVSIKMIVSGSTKNSGMILVMITSAAMSVAMHECGHRLSRDAGLHVGRCLARANLSKLEPRAIEEVKLFLKNVSMNYPSIQIAGAISINRFAITSMISVSVTYLIVLVQWQVDDKTDALNESFKVIGAQIIN